MTAARPGDDAAAPSGPVLVRPRRAADAAPLGDLLVRDRPVTGYPAVPPVDAAAWVAGPDDLAAFVATDGAGAVVGHVGVQAAAAVDHGTGPALQEAWSRALGRPVEECAVVARLFVSARHQRRGVGARLLERAVGWVEGRGMAPCLDVLPLPDDGALCFYECLGWVRAAELWAHWHRPGWPPLVALVLPAGTAPTPGVST